MALIGHPHGLLRQQQRFTRFCDLPASLPASTSWLTSARERTVGEGWQLLRIRGIPLRIHPTWFLILLMATLAFERHYRLILATSLPEAGLWLVALATAVLLFVSVLLHELGHALVALSQGVKVRSITLFLLGGVASVERECPTALGALAVALAGPLVSLALALALLAGVHPVAHQSPVLGEMVTQLGVLNLVLALFNLLPGLPLDGGLVVKALVWQVTGSRRQGLLVANGCGRFLSFLAVGLGSVLLLRGGGLSGAWLLLLGWFGLGAARNQSQVLQVQQALRDLQVKDVGRRRFRVLEASTTLRELSRIEPLAPGGIGDPLRPPGPAAASRSGPRSAPTAIPSRPEWLLVCDRGRWRGFIDPAVLQVLPVQRWDSETVADHLQPLGALPSIAESAPLWQAVLQLDHPDRPRLLVLGPAGLPTGTLERPEVAEAVLKRIGVRLPQQLLVTAREQNGYPLGMALAQVVRSMLAAGEVQLPEGLAAEMGSTAPVTASSGGP
jgi:Zn-dependent protease